MTVGPGHDVDASDYYRRVPGSLADKFDLIAPHLPTDGPILDVGTGDGSLALALLDAGFDITGCDVAPRDTAFARLGRVFKANLATGTGRDPWSSSPHRRYAAAICSSTLHEVHAFADAGASAFSAGLRYALSVECALRELASILEPGATLVVRDGLGVEVQPSRPVALRSPYGLDALDRWADIVNAGPVHDHVPVITSDDPHTRLLPAWAAHEFCCTVAWALDDTGTINTAMLDRESAEWFTVSTHIGLTHAADRAGFTLDHFAEVPHPGYRRQWDRLGLALIDFDGVPRLNDLGGVPCRWPPTHGLWVFTRR